MTRDGKKKLQKYIFLTRQLKSLAITGVDYNTPHNHSLIFVIVFIYSQEDDFLDGQLTLVVEDALDGGPDPAFTPRSTVLVRSVKSGNAVVTHNRLWSQSLEDKLKVNFFFFTFVHFFWLFSTYICNICVCVYIYVFQEYRVTCWLR